MFMPKSSSRRGKVVWHLTGSLLVIVGLFAGALPINPVQAAESTFSLAPVNPEVASGSTIELSAWLNNGSSQAQEVTAYTSFSQTDPLGSLTGTVYRAGQAGQWTITARYGDRSAATSVTVVPGPVNHLAVNPNSQPETITVNNNQVFTAMAYDAQNNIISPVAVTWRLEGLVGTIDSSGRLSATNSGSGKVIAESNGVSASVDVAVRAVAANTNQSNVNSAAVNANATANANANTNSVAVNESANSQATDQTAETVPAATETKTTDACTALAWWWWLIFLIAYLALLYGYYFLIRGNRNRWWWLLPLLLTGAAVWLYYGVRCESVATWFPWVTVIGGLILTVFRPMRFTPTEGNPL